MFQRLWLKGQYHENFWSGVFWGRKSPLGPDTNSKTVYLFFAYSVSYVVFLVYLSVVHIRLSLFNGWTS